VRSRIRDVTTRKIWRIPSLLLIVVAVFTTTPVVFYTDRRTPTISVNLGSGCLIDGYHVVYGENLTARWTASAFRLNSNNSFSLDLRFDYISENPTSARVLYSGENVSTLETDLEYVTSLVLFQVCSANRSEPEEDYEFRYTEVIPILPKSSDSNSCLIEYCGNFPLGINLERIMTQESALNFLYSWIRIFRDSNGTFYYQWLQGGQNVYHLAFVEMDKIYDNLSETLLVYYPIPENVTSPLLEFDYVKWLRENVLEGNGSS
jgi:hypothetical protein